LGKVSRGKELGITVTIDPSSSFIQYPEDMTNHDLVVILGNLIDNAFDELTKTDIEKKIVDVYIAQEEQYLLIEVSDNGKGIPDEVKGKIFTRGFTTKESEGHGIGLYLVKSIVERVNGKIDILSN